MNQQNNDNNAVPDGYMRNAQGHLIPISTIRPIDLQRDELVKGIIAQAKELSKSLANFKKWTFADIAALVQLSAEQYNVKIGGDKGNVSLLTFDGKYKVIRAVQETLTFDERLQAAKELIDSCLRRWSKGAQPELQVLINDAFQVDKAGNINTNRVLSLRRLSIDDSEWRQAMDAISEAVQVSGSKSYIRIYERVGETDRYAPINLDLASL